MILGTAVAQRIGREVNERFADERLALQGDLERERTACGGWVGVDLQRFAERMEALADRQADAFIAAAEPVIRKLAGGRNGRRLMKRRQVVPRLREEVRSRFLPGGLTAAQVRAKLQEGEAQDNEIIGFFVDALEGSA